MNSGDSWDGTKMRSQPHFYDELLLRRQLPRHAAQQLRFIEVVALKKEKVFKTAAVTDHELYLVNPFSSKELARPLLRLTDIARIQVLPDQVDLFQQDDVNGTSSVVEVTTAGVYHATVQLHTFEEDSRLFFHLHRAWMRRKALAARGLARAPPLWDAARLQATYRQLEDELMGNGPCTAVVVGRGADTRWTIIQG
eukprot:g6629.t1